MLVCVCVCVKRIRYLTCQMRKRQNMTLNRICLLDVLRLSAHVGRESSGGFDNKHLSTESNCMHDRVHANQTGSAEEGNRRFLHDISAKL